MRYCKFRNKKGGSKVNTDFPKPSQTHASAEDVLGDMTQEQAIRNKSGGGKNDVVVPTMDQGGDESTEATKTAVGGLLQAQEDGKYDTPPPLKGGRRRTKRKRKKGRRLTKVCVKKCTRKCYTPKRGGKRRKTRRKNRKKRTRRGRGHTTPPRKKKPSAKPSVRQPISPPRKQWPQSQKKHKPSLPRIIDSLNTTVEQTNPKKLLRKARKPKTNVPRYADTATHRAFARAQEIATRNKPTQGVFSKPIFNPPKGKRGGRKTRKRMRKRKRKKTRK